MSVEEIKTRFRAEIDRRALDDQYVDRNEEREILQIAIQLGMAPDAAHAALAQVCAGQSYVLESEVVKRGRGRLEAASAAGGGVSQEDFDAILADTREAVQGKQNERYVKKLVAQVLDDAGDLPIRTGWFSDWYTALKKELGMA